MRVWLIAVGEPLPLDGHEDRIWRAGLCAELLHARGHEVLWWTSNVDHFRKCHHVQGEPRVKSRVGAAIQFLHGRLYRNNVSLTRILNHSGVARRFAERSRLVGEARPDVILCAFPTIELSREAVRYGIEFGVPVVVDVCDLWPDVLLGILPRRLRWFGRALLWKMVQDTHWALAQCDVIYAVSDRYLDWGVQQAGRMRSDQDRVFPLAYKIGDWNDFHAHEIDQRLAAAGAIPGAQLLVFTGTFGWTCDLATPIEAMRQLASELPGRVQLVVCGSGEREAEWRNRAAGVEGVAFVGWLSASQLAALLARSDLGLAAYAAHAPQGIPNKVIEYLAAGLPILSSLVGESCELLEEGGCGVHYAAGDVEQLALAIRTLVEDPDRARCIGQRARALFDARFSAEVVFSELADHLEQVASAGVAARHA